MVGAERLVRPIDEEEFFGHRGLAIPLPLPISILVALVACGVTPKSAGSDTDTPSIDPALADALQDALDASRDEVDAPGASLAVRTREGTWAGGSGLADVASGRAAEAAERMRTGSLTKSFTAAVVLQLRDEGELTLDDRIDSWVAAFPWEGDIRLRHLLTHTSGIPDYVTATGLLDELDEPHTPEEILAAVADDPVLFEPGTGWSYSNTNYILLGMVVEAATGESWGSSIRGRLLDPYELDDTFVEGEEDVQGEMARGYLQGGTDPTDVTDRLDPSLTWAAGAVVSTTPDLTRWAELLWGGAVLGEETTAEMTTSAVLTDGTAVGYGYAVNILPDEGGLWLGHSGQTMGFQASLWRYAPADGSEPDTVAALVNSFASDAGAITDSGWTVLDEWRQ